MPANTTAESALADKLVKRMVIPNDFLKSEAESTGDTSQDGLSIATTIRIARRSPAQYDSADVHLQALTMGEAVCRETRVATVTKNRKRARSSFRPLPGIEALESRLQLSGDLEGRVVDGLSGAPLPGISLEIWANGWYDTVTDGQGRFAFDDIQADHYSIWIDGDELNGRYYMGQYLDDVSVLDGQTTDIGNIELQPAGWIYGYVYDWLGNPIHSAEVWAPFEDAFDSEEMSSFDEETGQYRLFAPATSQKVYPIVVENATVMGSRYAVYGSSDPDALYDAWDLDETNAQELGFTFLGYGTGTGTFPGGYLTYAIVTGEHYVSEIDAIESDQEGFIAETVEAGGVLDVEEIGTSPDGTGAYVGVGIWEEDDEEVWFEGGFLAFEYADAPAWVKLHVVDHGWPGDPVACVPQIGADLYAASTSGTRGPDFYLSPGGTLTVAVVDENGETLTNEWWEVDVNLVADVPGGILQAPEEWIEDEEGALRGVIAGQDVYIELDYAWSDDGRSLGSRWYGPYRVAAGQTAQGPTIVLPQSGAVTGIVTDDGGIPVPNAEVSVVGMDIYGGIFENDDGDGSWTDHQGVFQVDGIPPGRYELVIEAEGYARHRTGLIINVESGQTAMQNVQMQAVGESFTVTGTIANFAQIAPRNAQGVILPYQDIEYDDFGRRAYVSVVAFPQNTTWDIGDFPWPERLFSGEADVEDGYDAGPQPSENPAGSFMLELPPGTHQIIAASDMPESVRYGEPILLSDPVLVEGESLDQLTNISLTIPIGTATIGGKLQFPVGHPGVVSDASAMVMLRPAGTTTGLGRAVLFPGPSGEYAFTGIPAGSYHLCVIGPGFAEYTSPAFTVAEGAVVSKGISLSLPQQLIVGHQPDVPSVGAVSAVAFRFADKADMTSFSLADDVVSFAGPGGPIAATAFAWIDSYTLQITFPAQTEVGTYELTVGPDILNLAGMAMNQDGNATPGEATDLYTAVFEIESPRPDLVVTHVDVPGMVIDGADIPVTFNIKNRGTATALAGSFADVVYLSADTTLDDGDGPMNAWVTADVPAGTAYQTGDAIPTDALAPGLYYVIVKTDGFGELDEGRFEGNNIQVAAHPVRVGVPLLTPDMPIPVPLDVTGDARYFRVDVSAGDHLRLSLEDDFDEAFHELYVSYAQAPTVSDYDYRAAAFNDADQTLEIAGTQAGSYYIMVLGRRIPEIGSEAMLTASLLGFELGQMTPTQAGNSGAVTTTLRGSGFLADASVTLSAAGMADLPGEVQWVSTGELRVTFDATGATPGVYDVTVEQGDAELQVLPGAFTIVAGGEADLWSLAYGPQMVRPGRAQSFWIEYGNRGTMDATNVSVFIAVPAALRSELIIPGMDPLVHDPLLTPPADGQSFAVLQLDTARLNAGVSEELRCKVHVTVDTATVDVGVWAVASADAPNGQAALVDRIVRDGSWISALVINSSDPNEMVGPSGIGGSRFVSADMNLDYEVYFENDPDKATAAAQEVHITAALANGDIESFEFTDIVIGARTIDVPTGVDFFSQIVDLRPDMNLLLSIEAGLDPDTLSPYWTFTSLDPDTMALPDDALAGFLPVNDASHAGEGKVGYRVRPLAGLFSRTEITGKASIVFDVNAPLATNEVHNPVITPHITELAAGGQTKATFADADGDAVTIAFGGKAGSVQVIRDVAEGLSGDVLAIVAKDTIASSSLTITAKAASRGKTASTQITDLIVQGPLGKLTATAATLGGTMSVAGPLKSATWAGVESGRVLIGAPASAKDKCTLTLGKVVDTSLTSATPITSLAVVRWANDDETADRIEAPWLGKLNVAGQKAKAKGAAGVIGDFEADLVLTGQSAPVGKPVLGSATIAGDLNNSDWQIAGSMGKLTVKGTASDSSIRSTGSMLGITLGATSTSDFLAGILQGVSRHAETAGDFANASASIGSINVIGLRMAKGQQPPRFFINTSFSAATIRTVKLTNIDFDNGQESFGVFASSASGVKAIGPVIYKDSAMKTTTKWLALPVSEPDFTVEVIG